MQNSPQHNLTYDYVRAVAIILVVIGHSVFVNFDVQYGGWLGYVQPEETSLMYEALSALRAWIYSFHMPLFMALSGCVFAIGLQKGRLGDFAGFVSRKFWRLIVPVFVVAILWCVPLKLAIGWFHGSIYDVMQSVVDGQIFVLRDGSHLWFPWSLFFIFCYAWVIEQIGLRRYRVAFFFLLFVVWYFSHLAQWHWTLYRSFQYLFWFYAGVAFEEVRPQLDRHLGAIRNPSGAIVLLVFLSLLAYTTMAHSANLYVRLAGYFVNAASWCLAVYGVCFVMSRSGVGARSMTLLSGHSYAIFLLSEPLNYVIVYFVASWFTLDIVSSSFATLLLFVSRVLLSVLISLLVVRLVSLDSYRRITYPKI